MDLEANGRHGRATDKVAVTEEEKQNENQGDGSHEEATSRMGMEIR